MTFPANNSKMSVNSEMFDPIVKIGLIQRKQNYEKHSYDCCKRLRVVRTGCQNDKSLRVCGEIRKYVLAILN